jgi:hypothetical protein
MKPKIENSKAVKTWSSFSPIKKSILLGIFTIVIYLTVVVVTTPALGPLDAINAAFQLNFIVIFGMGIGIGLQIFLAEKGKLLGCKLDLKKRAMSGNSGSTALTSFFSFFSLVPLGCCGWWLYAMSLLPSIFGIGVSAVLIEYSQTLAYLGLAVIFGFNALTAIKLKKEMKKREFA